MAPVIASQNTLTLNMLFNKIFKSNKKIIIGAIHLPPLLGYPDFPGFTIAIKNAIKDLQVLERGGVSGIIFENNYDLPHKIVVNPEVVCAMMIIGAEIRTRTKLPVGVSVLWNDYKAALALAKSLSLQFIRIPAFVDAVRASCGIVSINPHDVLQYRSSIGAESVALFTDIHVKHAELLSGGSIVDSAVRAKKYGSDAVIVTGDWTGDAPDITELSAIRKKLPDFPILAGSGVDVQNSKNIFSFVNGAIVSTSLKIGGVSKREVNLKKYSQRISLEKVRRLVRSL